MYIFDENYFYDAFSLETLENMFWVLRRWISVDEDNLDKAQLCLQSRDLSTDSRNTSGCVSPALLQLSWDGRVQHSESHRVVDPSHY